MSTRLQLAAKTHKGLVRAHNDDTFLLADLLTGARHGPESVSGELQSTTGFACAVLSASGGFRWGQPGGEMAAEARCTALLGASVPASLGAAMRAASDAIVDEVARDRRREGLTVVAMLGVVSGESIHLIHVGDTRAYLLRCGRLTPLTRDDTALNDALDAGHSPERYPPSVVTRALGYRATVDAALVSTLDLRAGDAVTLCSRGLHALVDTPTIERVLVASPDPTSARDTLHQLAIDAGAPYNVTIVVMRPTGDALRAPTPDDVVLRRAVIPGIHLGK